MHYTILSNTANAWRIRIHDGYGSVIVTVRASDPMSALTAAERRFRYSL